MIRMPSYITSNYFSFYNSFADFYYKIKFRNNKKRRKKRNRQLFRKYCKNLPKYLPEAIFVKVGANDGITADPCSDILIENKKWKGLLIEPHPEVINKLKFNFSDIDRFTVEQVAISEEEGEKMFYFVDQKNNEHLKSDYPWVSLLSSFDKNHILKHHDGALDPYIIEEKVKTNTLTDILKKNNINDFHLLHIDAEGHDLVVLKSLDFSVYSPAMIYIEYNHLSDSDIIELLNLFDKYEYTTYDCGIDYLAIKKKEYMKLM